MVTKLALTQDNMRLAADNHALREQISVLTTERDNARSANEPCVERCEELYAEVVRLTRLLAEADVRSKRLITQVNRGKYRNEGRLAAMAAAREAAMKSGQTTKASF